MAQRKPTSNTRDEQAARFSTQLAETLHALKVTHRVLASALGVTLAAVDSWTSNASPRLPGPANLARLFAVLEQRAPSSSASLRRILDTPTPRHPHTLTLPQHSNTPKDVPHNLPTPLTHCIGRERELADIAAYFTGHRGSAPQRLLSLIGTGGIGKTRLAIEAGRVLRSSFEDGVWLLELAPLNDGDLIATTLAAALGLSQQRYPDVITTLIDRLQGKKTLVILDNCEHLIDACAILVARLLSACAQLCILCTSRECLRIDGETVWRVSSLSVSVQPEEIHNPTLALRYYAVRLFVERAKAIERNFTLTDDNVATVSQICQRLDGIPLALELAAASLYHFDVAEIATQLDDRFNLLTHGSRAALPRQQTLRALIDWSYDLLNPSEQVWFAQISVFAGGLDEEIAAVFATQLATHPADVSLTLRLLADKSLIQAQTVHGNTRYTMLESLREYATEKLSITAETKQQAETAHLNSFVDLAQQAKIGLLSVEQVHWVQRLEADLDNIRSALDRSCQNPQLLETGLQLANALGWFWNIGEHDLEGIRWLNRLLMLAPETLDLGTRAQSHFFLGFLQWFLADYANATPNINRSLHLWQTLSNATGLAYANIIHTHLRRVHGQLSNQDCMTLIEVSAQTFREMDDDWGLSIALGRIGSIALDAKDYDRAMLNYEEAYAARHRAGLTRSWAGALANLGFAAMCKHDFDSALKYSEQAVVFGKQYNSTIALMTALCNLGHIHYRNGDAARALEIFVNCLTRYRDLGIRDHIIATLAGIAYATSRLATPLRAAILLAAVCHQMESSGIRIWDIERETFDAALVEVRHMLDAQIMSEAWEQGQAMTLAQTIEFALASA